MESDDSNSEPPPASDNESSSRTSPPIVKHGVGRVPLARADFAAYRRRVRVLYCSSGAVILGNVLEWYDWTVYGYMEDLISELFMEGRHTATWMVFGLSFLARPVGAVLLGWVGDRWGRSVSLNIAIWGMAASTVLSGCLIPGTPGGTWGLMALRVLSGISAGGEAAGVNTYMSEVGGAEKDETLVAAVGVNNVSGALAFFFANVVALAVHQLPRSSLVAWGWRLPFLFALPIGIASVILRRSMPETEEFKAMQAARAVDAEDSGSEDEALSEVSAGAVAPFSPPVHAVPAAPPAELRGGLQEVLLAIVLCVIVQGASVSWNYLPVYLAQWLRSSAGFSSTAALGLSATLKVVQLLMTFPVSYFGDCFGAVPAMIVGNVASACLALPCFWVVLYSVKEAPVAAQALAFLLLGVVLPVCMSFFVVSGMLFVNSLFPARLRARGAGLGYGLASTVGGFAPAISSMLASQGACLPALYITVLTLPSLAVLLWCRRAAARGTLAVYQRSWLF